MSPECELGVLIRLDYFYGFEPIGFCINYTLCIFKIFKSILKTTCQYNIVLIIIFFKYIKSKKF